MAVEDADVAVVDEHGDFGAGAAFAEADVVQAAVVADGDGAGGVDGVGAYAAVGGDDVAGGGGFGSVGVGLGRSASVECSVWSALVVVDAELVAKVLELSDRGRGVWARCSSSVALPSPARSPS